MFNSTRAPILDIAMGNVANPAYLPVVLAEYGQNMNFWQRTINTLIQ